VGEGDARSDYPTTHTRRSNVNRPVFQLLGSCLPAQYGKRLLSPAGCLSQSDFRPAQAHRNPGGDQLHHELAGVTAIIRQVIGELDASAPLVCHDPHFKWRRACRKAVPVQRQPVPFGEVEEHRRIAARGNDPSGRGIGLEPMLFEQLLPHHTLHTILSIENEACSTVRIEHGRGGGQLLEPPSGFLAACAIAGAGQNRLPNCLELDLAASARRGKVFVLFLVHCAFPMTWPSRRP
jgi:hypothetical protein